MLLFVTASFLYAVHCLADLNRIKLMLSIHHLVLFMLDVLIVWHVVLVGWVLISSNVLDLNIDVCVSVYRDVKKSAFFTYLIDMSVDEARLRQI